MKIAIILLIVLCSCSSSNVIDVKYNSIDKIQIAYISWALMPNGPFRPREFIMRHKDSVLEIYDKKQIERIIDEINSLKLINECSCTNDMDPVKAGFILFTSDYDYRFFIDQWGEIGHKNKSYERNDTLMKLLGIPPKKSINLEYND